MLLAAAAGGPRCAIGRLADARLEAQGTQPVRMCIAAMRHFRALHAAACDPAGAEA
jgi:DNA polymerase III subunit delta